MNHSDSPPLLGTISLHPSTSPQQTLSSGVLFGFNGSKKGGLAEDLSTMVVRWTVDVDAISATGNYLPFPSQPVPPTGLYQLLGNLI
jgi:hypothetical protein